MSSIRFGVLACVALSVLGAISVQIPAAGQGGPVGGSGSEFYLNDAFTGSANVVFSYGESGDVVFFGDWDGDGVDTPLISRGNVFYVRNTNTSGVADFTFSYGDPGDDVLSGDWDGDGVDTLAVRRGATYFVKNSMSTGVADVVITYGEPWDSVLVGDWNGDGVDTLAVRRETTFFVKDSISTGVADYTFVYGNPGDIVLVGDWDGDGADTLAVRRVITYYLRNSATSGVADVVFAYGNPTDTAFAGDWNADRADTIGIRRPPPTQTVDCRVLSCVALTFDDGPSTNTSRLLDILQATGARATFFLLGERVSMYPAVVGRMAALGMEVGNHSWNHPDLTTLASSSIFTQLFQTSDVIESVTGDRPGVFRPPYGAHNSTVDTIAGQQGMAVILWSVDTLDWKYPDAARVRSVAGSAPAGAIVLMHDTHSTTVDAVPGIISDLRARGITPVSVSELLGWPVPGQVYTRQP